ncbi:MAG TPA: S1C family serine protease [Ilumatobacteraceae bacterium]|nr:S1C family serine protease [Ilumatobacteraceae bacterium]HRB03186.1 S1C family serine protease [Ilumatobacteraceae bacterium]
MKHGRHAPLAIFLSAATVLAACGSDSVGFTSSTTIAPATTSGDVTTTAVAPPITDATGGDITSFSDVQPAVLQFEGAGAFREPGSTEQAIGWRGSGFFISPDGLAVTNNHVVSGAATLKVFVGGDSNKSYNATVVGASECNDLALVQVDIPGTVPYLNWATEEIKPGLDIYVAGFPLGDPEFTLVSGIISKANANGETNWASIDGTVQYDAQQQPGNSGGPVVDKDGKVVAVAYAGGDVGGTGTSQFFGINNSIAQSVVKKLKDGDFESIGINAKAFVNQDIGLAGVWVSGVAAGSPASTTGLLPGDVILSLNGLPVGQDGSMSAYCDVLRTAGSKPIKIEVLRFDTGEILTGEINGTKTLVVSQLLATEETPVDLPPAQAEYTYEEVIDDTNQILIEVPVEWAQRQTTGQTLNDGDHAAIVAAPDLDSFLNTDTATGILVAGFLGSDWSAILDAYEGQLTCTDKGDVQDLDNGYLAGAGLVYSGCGDAGGSTGLVVLGTPDGKAAILMIAQLNSDADFDALNRAIGSLQYVPTV